MCQIIFSELNMIFKSSTLLLTSVLLSGCATLDIVTFGLSGISFITTGKSLSDHAISAVTDQDCAIHRFIFDESICRQTNGTIGTNGEVMLAKNSEPESIEEAILVETPLEVPSVIEANNALPTDNIQSYSLASISAENKPITPAELEINRQYNIVDEQDNKVAQYKVIGSFNNKSYALTRANLYQNMGAVVISNHKNNRSQINNTKYRVVLGPYLTDTQLPELGKIAKTEKSADWLLSLCTKTLSPPPCMNENITLAQVY